jgi:predicted small secreted protein
MLKKTLLVATLIALIFALTGCQTLEGLGKDIEWVGQHIGGGCNATSEMRIKQGKREKPAEPEDKWVCLTKRGILWQTGV